MGHGRYGRARLPVPGQSHPGRGPVPLQVATRLRYDLDVHFRSYLHANTLLPIQNPGSTQREDTEQNHVFKVEQPAAPGCSVQEGSATRAPLTLAVAVSDHLGAIQHQGLPVQPERDVGGHLLPVLSRWSAATGGGALLPPTVTLLPAPLTDRQPVVAVAYLMAPRLGLFTAPSAMETWRRCPVQEGTGIPPNSAQEPPQRLFETESRLPPRPRRPPRARRCWQRTRR